MKIAGIGLAVLLAAGLTGCVTHPVDNYSDLPGSGDHMAKGPGLLAGSQKDTYDGGYEVYSLDLSKVGKKDASDKATSESTDNDQQSFKQFKEFQDYQRFENMPKDSADYREFKKWQQWQEYKQWKAQQHQ